VYRGDKRYELSDHLGNVHVVVSDRKQLHCGQEEDVLYPEYYTAEVKNRYDYYPFGMLMEERKYAAPDCRYETDTVFTAVFSDYFNTSTTDWLYIDGFANPSVSGGYMHLDQEENTLIRVITPTAAGKQYRVRFGVDMNGCNAALVAGNIQNLTTQTFSSSGDHVFYFSSNDSSYTGVSFYIEDPCDVLIDYVIVEEMTISSAVVCDSAARCSTVTREEELFVLDEDFDGACSTELEEDFTTSCSNLFSDDFNSGYNTSRYIATHGTVTLNASGGTLNMSSIYNSQGITVSLATTAGSTYTVSFDLTALVHATMLDIRPPGGVGSRLAVRSTGAVEYTFKATGSTSNLSFLFAGGMGSTMTVSIDNLSVCELDKDVSMYGTNATLPEELSYSGGKLHAKLPAGFGAKLSFATVAGESYTARFDVSLFSPATSITVKMGSGTGTQLNILSSGTVEYTFKASSSTSDVILTPADGGSVSKTIEVDNIHLCRHSSALGAYTHTYPLNELSFSSGKLIFTSPVGNAGIVFSVPTSSGTSYTLKMDLGLLANVSTVAVRLGTSGTPLLVSSSGSVTFNFTASSSSSQLYIYVYTGSSGGKRVSVDNIRISYLGEVTETVCDPGSGYRYGFNGQMKDDEVYGVEGTSYTAEYWQYDSRLGRRWNVDPVYKSFVSNYSCLSNNPIVKKDPLGNADYYSESGTFLGSDGKSGDGRILVVTDRTAMKLIKENTKNGLTTSETSPELSNNFFELPSYEDRQQIKTSLENAKKNDKDYSYREYGGVKTRFSNGIERLWDLIPGEPVGPEDERAMIHVTPLARYIVPEQFAEFDQFLYQNLDYTITYTWHSHPSGRWKKRGGEWVKESEVPASDIGLSSGTSMQFQAEVKGYIQTPSTCAGCDEDESASSSSIYDIVIGTRDEKVTLHKGKNTKGVMNLQVFYTLKEGQNANSSSGAGSSSKKK